MELIKNTHDLPNEYYGYFPPLATQYNKFFIAFASNRIVLESLYFNSYIQLRRLAGISASEIHRREDQIIAVHKFTSDFIKDFFSGKLRNRIYYVMLALLPRKSFTKLHNIFGKHKGLPYPGDILLPNLAKEEEEIVLKDLDNSVVDN